MDRAQFKEATKLGELDRSTPLEIDRVAGLGFAPTPTHEASSGAQKGLHAFHSTGNDVLPPTADQPTPRGPSGPGLSGDAGRTPAKEEERVRRKAEKKARKRERKTRKRERKRMKRARRAEVKLIWEEKPPAQHAVAPLPASGKLVVGTLSVKTSPSHHATSSPTSTQSQPGASTSSAATTHVRARRRSCSPGVGFDREDCYSHSHRPQQRENRHHRDHHHHHNDNHHHRHHSSSSSGTHHRSSSSSSSSRSGIQREKRARRRSPFSSPQGRS
jgi:hypothetical protein